MTDFSIDPFAADRVAERSLSIAPLPEWVIPKDVPWFTVGKPDDHLVVLLSQTHWIPLEGIRFEREVRRLVTREAVQKLSQVEVQWDPHTTDLVLHEVALWRQGASRSFCERARVLLRQREGGLESQILHGRMSAIILLDDVRQGDCVELAYTTRTHTRLPGEKFDFFFPMEWRYVTGAWSVTVQLPESVYFQSASSDGSVPLLERQGDLLLQIWSGTQSEVAELEVGAPNWLNQNAFSRISGYHSWSEVADFLWSAWKTLEFHPLELPKFVEEQVGHLASLEEKVLNLLLWIQDEVRYLGIEGGLGAIVPNAPSDVLRQRYGDCKDKSLLLCCFLRHLGLEASPVLVHSALRHTVADFLPGAATFDHAIACFTLNGRRVFVDPTQAHQGGGVFHRCLPDYRKGLLLCDDSPGLVDVVSPTLERSALLVSEDFFLSDKSSVQRVLWRFEATGWDADWLRARLLQAGAEGFAKAEAQSLHNFFLDAQSLGPAQVTDDRTLNRLVITGATAFARWGEPLQRGHRVFRYEPRWMVGFLTYPPKTPNRKTPLALRRPALVRHEISVHAKGHLFDQVVSLRSESPWFRAFTHIDRPSNTQVRCVYHYEGREELVNADSFTEYVEGLMAMLKKQVGCNVALRWKGAENPVLPSSVDPPDVTQLALASRELSIALESQKTAQQWFAEPPKRPWSAARLMRVFAGSSQTQLRFRIACAAFGVFVVTCALIDNSAKKSVAANRAALHPISLATPSPVVNPAARIAGSPVGRPNMGEIGTPPTPDPRNLDFAWIQSRLLLEVVCADNRRRLAEPSDKLEVDLGVLLSLAEQKLEERSFDKAAELSRKVLARAPTDLVANRILMVSLAGELRRAEANALGQTARAAHPKDAMLCGLLAENYMRLNLWSEALQYASEAAQLGGGQVAFQVQHADILHRLRRSDEALERIQAALASEPNSAVALFEMGSILVHKNDPKALEFLQKLVLTAPLPAHRLFYAAALIRLGRKTDGLELLDKLVTEDPGDRNVWETLEKLYRDLNLPEKVSMVSKRILELPRD